MVTPFIFLKDSENKVSAMLIKIPKVNSVCLFEYEDASYSYIDVLNLKVLRPKFIKTIGWLRRVEKDFIDIGLIVLINEDGDIIKYERGLVVPIRAVNRIKLLYEK